MHKIVYIYIVRIPSRIPILHKHAFPDRLAGTALRGTPFPWAAHTPRIPKSVSSKAWRAHWLLSGPRKEKETKPGNRARRWGTLKARFPKIRSEDSLLDAGNRAHRWGLLANEVPEECEEAICPSGPRIPPRAYPPTLQFRMMFAARRHMEISKYNM